MTAVGVPGLGTDIVSVARIERLIGRAGERFTTRWFTPGEIVYCTGKAFPGRHFAARLAAKEAVVKALGLPPEGPLPWRSVEIVHERGAPCVRLHGTVLAAARGADVGELGVSLSHCDEYAVALAWVVGRPAPGTSPTSGRTLGPIPAGGDTP